MKSELYDEVLDEMSEEEQCPKCWEMVTWGDMCMYCELCGWCCPCLGES